MDNCIPQHIWRPSSVRVSSLFAGRADTIFLTRQKTRRRTEEAMRIPLKRLTACATIALASSLAIPAASAQTVDAARLAAADQNANDWLTYHGSYKSYHYSLLDQINAGNVKG